RPGARGVRRGSMPRREDEEQEELKERVERLEEEQNHSSSSSDHERAHSPDVDDW
ncbi:hypothetical protein KXV72_005431, partial [Aspergillus fumigatus]